jgi:hypothetical protein
MTCDDVKNDSQCNLISDEGCTFIFDSNDGYNGTCVDKKTETYDCDDIKRINQCNNGGEIAMLNDVCGTYTYEMTRCEVKCSKILNDNICENDRSNDCFWIMNDEENSVNIQCVNKV